MRLSIFVPELGGLAGLLGLFGLLVLASCHSMSKEECMAADWRVIGEADGAAGYSPQDRFGSHVESCARIKVVPDQTKWNDGYQNGLKRYCTPLNGLARGEAGDTYHSVCPPETSEGFLRGYGLGRRLYSARSDLNSIRSDISAKESRMDERYRALKAAKDDNERRNIRNEIDDLDRDIRRAQRDMPDRQFDVDAAQRDLDSFRANPQAPLPVPGY
ncbi:DUF2799 domain-containing protein [Rhizobium sp. SSA_523]|uniref:DUF2799 domain-containing protein n=1 Tax=Rhizobium sp. SSA_523 TaxID=2952477 RepID=UPI0020903854|nr:DUF2799 domain-containing protein [Rhizobium sp. SSA_523]MCO5733729.1 DUF2799 domain-containing protein [Rhizobium sp. SSA_523]WKC24996.1 DUF2799 domain-containing protein [Rhizobium sp. SSA_523]